MGFNRTCRSGGQGYPEAVGIWTVSYEHEGAEGKLSFVVLPWLGRTENWAASSVV